MEKEKVYREAMKFWKNVYKNYGDYIALQNYKYYRKKYIKLKIYNLLDLLAFAFFAGLIYGLLYLKQP